MRVTSLKNITEFKLEPRRVIKQIISSALLIYQFTDRFCTGSKSIIIG